MLQTREMIDVYADLLVVVAVALALSFCAWLANDLLWERWEGEQDKEKARQLTWLIAANVAGVLIGTIGLVWLALRASVW